MHVLDDIFSYSSIDTSACLERLLGRYERDGKAITVNFRQLVNCLTSPERATHLIHAYPAKLLMHIPFFFLANSIFSKRGNLVFDPFCGSGTVLIESLLSGRSAVGFDNNPLACLISKVKTTFIQNDKLGEASRLLIDRIPRMSHGCPPDVVNLYHWYHPHVIRQLQCIRKAIGYTPNQIIRNFFNVCFSQCVRKVSLADPRLAVPVRLKEGQYPFGHPLREKSDERLRWLRRVNVQNVFEDILKANIERVATLSVFLDSFLSADVFCRDARSFCLDLKSRQSASEIISDASVNLIITSPPYPGAQKYVRSTALSIGWLGLCPSSDLIDLKRATIGREEYSQSEYGQTIVTGIEAADRLLKQIRNDNPVRAAIAGTYLNEMHDVLSQCYRVLKRGGYMVLVAANNRIAGHNFRTQEFLRRIGEGIGFNTVLRLKDSIRSRGLMTKRNRTASVIDSEWVIVFKK